MPTLTTHEMFILSGAVDEIRLMLTGEVTIDMVSDAYDALGNVLTALTSCENPDGCYPIELEPGDLLRLDADQFASVIGYPWSTRISDRHGAEKIVAVPVETGVLFLPPNQKVDAQR